MSSTPGTVDGSSGPYSPGPNFSSGPAGSDGLMGLSVGQKRPSATSGMCGGGRAKKACLQQDKMHHIKKPLNAFMLYMKEMRPKIVAECTLKESAAINQILGRRVSREVILSGCEKIETSFFSVARFEQGGAGKVLRAGEERAPVAHAAVPGVVGEGQLRHEQEEEEEAADAAPAERGL